jgi:hypothetical protein
MRSGALKRSKKKLETRKALKSQKRHISGTSKRISKYEREFLRVRPKILDRDGHRCRVQTDGCWKKAQHVHHIKMRSAGGSNKESNLLSVCLYCHAFVHANQEWAKERGFLE